MFGSVLAGVVALALFAVAWLWNSHMQNSRIVGYLCVGIAVMGSVVLYASALAMWLSKGAVSLVDGVGDMLGAGSISNWVLGFVCIAAFGITVYDLIKEPEHNPKAIACMVIAPIAAHGTLDVMHKTMEVIYGGLSIGTLDALQRFFGA